MIRDVLAARLAEMTRSGARPDYPLLALEVLGIRGATADLARRLVEQALVVEDRRDHWRRTGDRVCEDAPHAAGVYVFRDADGRALYVGKAASLRRRLRAHFADSRWRTLHPAVARVDRVEWETTGSEIEALLREAMLIGEMQPVANVQIGEPALHTRAVPTALARDVVVLVPSTDSESVTIVSARAAGGVLIQTATRAAAPLVDIVALIWAFFHPSAGDADRADGLSLAPLVFSWLAGRGRQATRIDPHDASTEDELCARLGSLVNDPSLFLERLIQM
jgi:predicted GIY-YIG superfamily endonuclease